MSDFPPNHRDDPERLAEARASLSSEDRGANLPGLTREQALLRLGEQLPPGAFGTVRLTEVAQTASNLVADLRAGHPARFYAEWSVTIVAPGYSQDHAGDELGPVVEQALADYQGWKQAREAEEWARNAVPDKPPKLLAPGTAEAERERREKDAG
jgi:hypothetical protein